MEPYVTLDNELFRNFINGLQPRFNIPSSKVLRIRIEPLYKKVQYTLWKELKTDICHGFSITTDIWSSPIHELHEHDSSLCQQRLSKKDCCVADYALQYFSYGACINQNEVVSNLQRRGALRADCLFERLGFKRHKSTEIPQTRGEIYDNY